MGSLFGGGTTTQSSSASSSPWAAQQPYLTQGFSDAANTLANGLQSGSFTGSLYSPDNATQLNSATAAGNFTSGVGQALPTTTANTANTMQSGATDYVNNATNLANNGVSLSPTYTNAVGNLATNGAGSVASPLSGALQSAAVSGANGIAAGQTTLQNAANQAMSNQTGQTIASANQYANNPAVQAAQAAADQPITQTLQEQTLPGLNRQASEGGNLNSSRAGAAEAMANNNAASQLSNTNAAIQSNAYNNGLSLSAQQQEAGTNAAINAGLGQINSGTSLGLGVGDQQLSQAGLNANTQLSAANTGINSQFTNANTTLNANAQLGEGVNSGVNAATAAGTQAAQNLATGEAAGGVSQADQNAQLANAYAEWQNQNGSYQQGLLNSYMGEVGGSYGQQSTGTQTTTQPANVIGGLAGLGLTGASLFSSGGALNGAFSGLGGSLGGLFTGFNTSTGLPTQSTLGSLSGQANQNVLNGAAGL